MKKFLCAFLIIVLCLSMAGCGRISGEKAIDIALKDLGISRVGAARTDAYLDDSGDSDVYDVEINMNYRVEHYVIDAQTGKILSSETVMASIVNP